MNEYDRRGATRFVTGLAVGAAVSTLLVGLVVASAAALLSGVSAHARVVVAVAALLALGVFDLANRTPELARQVPQRFVRVLDPGVRGLFWGADLATLVSTRKSSSLLWVCLVVLPLLGSPALAVGAVVAANAAFVAGVALQTKLPRLSLMQGRFGAVNISADIRSLRRVTGVLVLVATVWLATRGVA